MIAAAKPEPPEEPEDVGDYGGGASARRISLEHTRMIERAVREGWPIPEEKRPAIVARQVRIALSKRSSPREATSAARCLLGMEQQNVDRVFKVLDKIVPDQHHVGITNQPQPQLQELLAEPSYVEYLRQRTVDQDCDSGAVCQVRDYGNGQALANGQAHGGAGPGTNGHRNGSE